MQAVRYYFSGVRRMMYPLVSLILLVVLDGVITNVVVDGGLAREGNPFLVPLVGGGSFLVLKAVGALFCAFVLWDIYRHRPKMALTSTSCLVVAYTGIVFWNLTVFFTGQV